MLSPVPAPFTPPAAPPLQTFQEFGGDGAAVDAQDAGHEAEVAAVGPLGPIALRPYQERIESEADGISAIVRLPTGAGKTLVAAELIRIRLQKDAPAVQATPRETPLGMWRPHPFPGCITHVGSWRGGYASLWFPGGKLKVIPAECGRLMTVTDEDGRMRTPYSRQARGKPKHVSRRWWFAGSDRKNGFREHADPSVFVEYRESHAGISLRTRRGHTVALLCEFDRDDAPRVGVVILPGDVNDDHCSSCAVNLAAKRCFVKRCRRCCDAPACVAHQARKKES